MSKRIELARRIFKEAFEQDEYFRDVYRSNIAMLLYDRYGIKEMKERNQAAHDIMEIIFEAKEYKSKKKIRYNTEKDFTLLDL